MFNVQCKSVFTHPPLLEVFTSNNDALQKSSENLGDIDCLRFFLPTFSNFKAIVARHQVQSGGRVEKIFIHINYWNFLEPQL